MLGLGMSLTGRRNAAAPGASSNGWQNQVVLSTEQHWFGQGAGVIKPTINSTTTCRWQYTGGWRVGLTPHPSPRSPSSLDQRPAAGMSPRSISSAIISSRVTGHPRARFSWLCAMMNVTSVWPATDILSQPSVHCDKGTFSG
jgi:hypothetical protein